MDKFKMKHPTNADFEEKLAKYAKLADDVWRQANSLYRLHMPSYSWDHTPATLHTVSLNIDDTVKVPAVSCICSRF